MLSLKSQKNPPEDPSQFMSDFFGHYRSPMWDQMDEWREENETIRSKDLPEMSAKIAELEKELAFEKRKVTAFTIYKAADPDATVSSNVL